MSKSTRKILAGMLTLITLAWSIFTLLQNASTLTNVDQTSTALFATIQPYLDTATHLAPTWTPAPIHTPTPEATPEASAPPP